MPNLELTIAELGPGGEGVAITPELGGERRAVFVPGVARGERIRADVDASRRPARGRLLEVLAPSPARVAPACAHVARCGGCDWMHLAADEQAREHAAIVEALLGAPVTAHAAPAPLGYRARTRLHVVAKRGIVVGMHGRGTHEPAAVDTCVVLDPIVDAARAALATWLEGARGTGEASLALGRPGPDRRAVLELRWRGDLPAAVFGRLEGAPLAGARVFSGEVTRPAILGDPTPFVVGADGAPLALAVGGFSQASEAGNALLAAHVAALAAAHHGPTVELHAGAGNLSVLLAKDRPLVTVEASAEACAAARANLAARGLTARITNGDADTFAIPRGTALVVLDPPREGARAVAERLAAERAKRKRGPAIVYVSCDPPTLARDVKILTGAGYVVRRVDTFEMFPQTSHVETVVALA